VQRAPVEPPPPPQHKSAPSVWSKNFDRAQKALWTGQSANAESILRDLLRKSLSRRDRAHASKMMGDAEAKRGHKSSAASWYKKSLKLSDDPDDRARLQKLLQR